MPEQTVADLLGSCLAALGVRRVFGEPIPGLAHVAVDDPHLARLLADADGRSGTAPGVAFLAGHTLRLSSRPGIITPAAPITEVERIPGLLATWGVGSVHAAAEFAFEVDLDASAPADLEPLVFEHPPELYTLSPTLADLRIVVLAGPGVVRSGQVDALQSFAAQAGVGVLNTWGAKGVFPWDSPFHFGTGGLQERDFELAGFRDVDLVIAAGVDEDESPRERWEFAQSLEVEPESLLSLAFNWPPPERAPERPRLYTELSAALASHYTADDVPLRPARAAADLAEVRPNGGLVAADPGPAGLWVARAFPTTEPGSVVVPATPVRGFAAAAAFVAGLDGRPAIGVTTTPLDAETEAVVEFARQRGVHLVLEEWGADGELSGPAEHRSQLIDALHGTGVHVLAVPVDFAQTRVLVDVAGPVVAWGLGGPGAD